MYNENSIQWRVSKNYPIHIMPTKPYISIIKTLLNATDLQMNPVTPLTIPSQNYVARSTSIPFLTRLDVWMTWGAPTFLLPRSISVHTASVHNPNYMMTTKPAYHMHASQDTQPDSALHACFIWQYDGCTFIVWEPRSRLSCFTAEKLRIAELQKFACQKSPEPTNSQIKEEGERITVL